MFLLQPGRCQGCKTRFLQNSSDKGQCRGGRDRQGYNHPWGCMVAGLKSRAGLLPPRQHPHQSSAKRPAETGRTLGHQHCQHNINGQKFLEEKVFRNITRGEQRTIMANVLTSLLGKPSRHTTPVTHPGRGQCIGFTGDKTGGWKPVV